MQGFPTSEKQCNTQADASADSSVAPVSYEDDPAAYNDYVDRWHAAYHDYYDNCVKLMINEYCPGGQVPAGTPPKAAPPPRQPPKVPVVPATPPVQPVVTGTPAKSSSALPWIGAGIAGAAVVALGYWALSKPASNPVTWALSPRSKKTRRAA